MYHFKTSNFQPPRSIDEENVAPQRHRHEGNSPHHAVMTPALRTSAYRYAMSSSGQQAYDQTQAYHTAPVIHRNHTAPEVDEELFEIKRTGSGGLLFAKKRSHDEQEEISRARAEQLCALFEQSDSRDTQLNKHASVKHKSTEITAAPKLSTISAKEAVGAFRKLESEKMEHEKTKKDDPLLTVREQKAQMAKEQQRKRKAELKKKAAAKSHSSTLGMSRAPLRHRQSGRGDVSATQKATKLIAAKSRSNEVDITEEFSRMGFEVRPSGHHSNPVHNLPAIC